MGKYHTIFIVDDDPGFRKTLSDILKAKGYRPIALDQGKTALDKIDVASPEVALIDLRLEDMSGLDLLKEIKKRVSKTECILLTGHATQRSAIEAVNLGAYGYMQKPYDVEQLLVMIRRAIEKRVAEAALGAYAKRLQTLRAIDQAILEAQSSEAIAEAALQHIRHLVPCQWANVVTFDVVAKIVTILANYVEFETSFEVGKYLPLNAFPFSEGLREGQVCLVADTLELAEPTLFDQTLQNEGVRTYINVPLTSQNELIGAFILGADDAGAFTTDHIEIAREVAGQLAVAIQQTRLNEKVQDHANELEQRVLELQQTQTAEREQRILAETLREVTSVLNTSLDREHVLNILLEQLIRVVDYDGASVMLASDDTLHVVAGRQLRPGRSVMTPLSVDKMPHIQEVLQNRTPLVISDTMTDPRWLSLSGLENIRCWLGVPLVVQGRVIGLLNLSKNEPGFYTNRDAELAAAFAGQAAIAVDNAQLFERAQQEINERKRAEGQLQETIQKLEIAYEQATIYAQELREEISERKRVEAALAEERSSLARRVEERTAELSSANAELARAARLKDEFLAAMSHELRTPLNAVLGLSEALQEQIYGSLNERQLKSLRTIEESGRHLLSLINDILDVSKIEAGKLTLDIGPAPIEAICQSSIRLITQAAHKKRLKMSSTIDGAVTTIQADQRRLKQILVNLLSNAVKFTPEGQTIGLEVKSDKENQIVHFTIWDTGIGISADDMSRLFTPFVQLDSSLARQHAGTGLGLALVSRLTEMHGGGISVESEVDKGSRFTVSLPWSEVEEGRGASQNITLSPAADGLNISSLRRALIIEDSPTAADQVARYLTELKIETVIHPQGIDAIEKVVEVQPDFIILDILLPDSSGWDVLDRLKAEPRTCDIPVLIVSVVDDQHHRGRSKIAGHLVKPVSRNKLQAGLRRIVLTKTKATSNVEALVSEAIENGFPHSKPPLILLAEDNQTNINTLSDYLTHQGYQIVVARDGVEAIERAREDHPDLILMDIQMPGLDGLEATRQIRADTTQNMATVPIIALTALSMPGDKERCLAAGANEYMSKPVSLKRLIEVIETKLKLFQEVN